MQNSVGKIYRLGILLCIVAGLSVLATAPQASPGIPNAKATPIPAATPKSIPKMPPRPVATARPAPVPTPPRRDSEERITAERAVSVDPNVNLKLCVYDGSLTINGWERDEVRVFVRDGRKFEYRVLERNAKTEKPNWVWIAQSAGGGRSIPFSNCLSGGSVEIDVPINAVINLEARRSGSVIDSVKSVSVKVIEGSIGIRNVSGGVKAETYQGDIMLESSAGEISLKTTTGNIVAYDVTPGAIGDLLSANTSSGSISLQNVSHRQIKAGTISGSLFFNGAFLTGGIYHFKTSNGSIQMQLPKDTSCRVEASYGFGSFNSTIPLEVINEQITPGGKNVVAVIGAGDATVNVTTVSGSIAIKNQNQKK